MGPTAGLRDQFSCLSEVLFNGHWVVSGSDVEREVNADDVGAFLRKSQGVTASLASGNPGNKGDSAVETFHDNHSSGEVWKLC
jgi:hypothetical protein